MRPKVFATLFGRLAISIFVCLMLLGAAAAFLFLRGLQLYQTEVAQTLHKDLARYVAEHYDFLGQDKLNLDAAKNLFHDLMILGPNLEFYLLDLDGKILAYSTDPNNIHRTHISLTPLEQFLQQTTAVFPLTGQDPKNLSEDKIFSAAPIYRNKHLLGYLYVILNGAQYQSVADMVLASKMIRWSVLAFVVGVVCSLVVALLLTSLLTNPLRKLTAQVMSLQPKGFADAEVSVNELKRTWQKDCGNEIHILGCGFAELLAKLQEQHNSVVTMDHSRRELISHISHDLRTPLASLQGYLETWELNKNNLSIAESERYIGIARNNAQTLAKLIEQLFELAQLEYGNTPMNIEPLSLAELVQDVMQKFELQAQQKNIQLEVSPKDSTFQVVGDVEKLDRVVTNLVENALRHTGQGGSIWVKLERNGDYVSVQVGDTGIGIPSEDIGKIFDPHFKAGNTVRGNTSHGGLGLTITKKLLALHRADISVRSLKNAGACFEFSLPVQ